MKLHKQTPDLAHCWMRFAPRPWPGDDRRLWLDLSTNRLGRGTPGAIGWDNDLDADLLDDVVYLPPVESELQGQRAGLIKNLQRAAIPVLVQQLAGATSNEDEAAGVFDVLHAVATKDLESLSSVPQGAGVVWPLVGGYTDDHTIWQEGLEKLARVGVKFVLGVEPDLLPSDRRRVVDSAGEEGFDTLFHGQRPSARAFSSTVYRYGLEPLPARPTGPLEGRSARNRYLAGQLSLIGEIWLRLGRRESQGQAYFRAARWIDRESHDLWLLGQEGNLGIVSWLDEQSCVQVREIVVEGRSRLLEELRREYLDWDLG